MRHEYRILVIISIVTLGYDVSSESCTTDREGIEEWVRSLEVVVGLEGKRLDSGGEVMGPGEEVEGVIERSTVPGGDDAMDAGIGSDGGIGGREESDQHKGYDSGGVS